MEKAEKPKQQKTRSQVPWNPWLGVVFVAVVFYVSQLFSGLILFIYPELHRWPHARAMDWLNNSTTAQFVYLLLASGAILGLIHLFLKRYGCTFATIGLRRPRWRDAGYGLMAAPIYYLLYLAAIGVVTHFVPGLNIDQQQQIGFNDVQGVLALSLAFVSLVVLPPLTEEIMVRGFLYSSLKKGLPVLIAALTTSLVFASLHLPEGGAAGPLYIAALDTFVLSLVLIYLREKTGGLWASITLHAVKNGIAFLTLFVLHVH
jgi:membrane protease YdiL (CAAX protease family)